MCPAQHLLLAAEHPGGKVVCGTSAREQRAMMALGLIFRAFATVMANAGERPLVMQRPHDRFPAVNDATDVFQRKETLVHPMEMDEVGFLKFGEGRDVRTGVGQIYLKQVFTVETVGRPYHKTFPQELGAKQGGRRKGGHGDLFRALVAHQHLGLYAIVVQGFHQAVCRNGCPSRAFGCVDNQDSHKAVWIGVPFMAEMTI